MRGGLGLGAVLAIALCVGVGGATSQRSAKKPRFVAFELPSTPPAAVGTTCPGSDDCWNRAVEPAIRADEAGAFYVSSENGLLEGTIAAKSVDGGLHYASLDSPNAVSRGEDVGFAPGGGDTDLAIAPARNAARSFNVYVASLTLGEITVSTSLDGGATWQINPTAARVPGDDREWIAADGAAKVCISYHDLPTFNVNVDCSYDAGMTFVQHASAIDLVAYAFLLQNNQIGNLAIDPVNDVVYQILVGIASPAEIACGIRGTCKYHAVWMAVSTDGGRTFSNYPVYVGASDQVGYGHVFPNVTVDRAGNVYAVFSDDHDVFAAVSTDQGKTWSTPARVNRDPAGTAIFPWAVAGDAGKLDVVYYGTSSSSSSSKSATWHAYFAQNLDATSPDSRFTQVRATPVVHRGGACESGISCNGNRDLYDDFGVAASPTNGLASIAYTSDQYSAQETARPGCTAQQSNTLHCDHTSIATQIGGPGIFGSP